MYRSDSDRLDAIASHLAYIIATETNLINAMNALAEQGNNRAAGEAYAAASVLRSLKLISDVLDTRIKE
jgi:hypothetical protein